MLPSIRSRLAALALVATFAVPWRGEAQPAAPSPPAAPPAASPASPTPPAPAPTGASGPAPAAPAPTGASGPAPAAPAPTGAASSAPAAASSTDKPTTERPKRKRSTREERLAANEVATRREVEPPPPVPSWEPPRFSVEARLSAGLGLGGGRGPTVLKLSTFRLSLLGDIRLTSTPWLSAYVSTTVEGVDRVGFGVGAGIRARAGKLFRVGGGLVTFIVPYTMVGLEAAPGVCFGLGAKKRARLCAELLLDIWVGGGDLPPGRVLFDTLLAVGVAFDAL